MGVIKTLLGIVIVVAIVVFGYWLYATYTIAAADDEMWVEVNSRMPDPLRKWACTEVNGRISAAEAPQGCADVWETASAPQATPSAPAQSNPAPGSSSGSTNQ